MNKEQIVKLFIETRALLEGHFELSSGLHSDKYCQCALVLQYPQYAEKLAIELARYFKDKEITCVIGPALGGVTLAYEVARVLGVRALFAERKDGSMQLRRGFSITKADRIVVVEDVITTGGSVKEVIGVLEKTGATIAGVGSLVDRSGGNVSFGYLYHSLIALPFKTFEPTQCPLCDNGSSAIKPGSRKL